MGVTAVNLESAYTTSPLTSTQIGTVEFTFSMLKDLTVSAVGRVIRAYASVSNHPFRTYNLSQTANVADKGVIPSTNSAGLSIVGVYGAIRDASTGETMTEHPEQEIDRIRRRTTAGTLLGAYYYYKIVGDRLRHTRTNAVVDVCTFDLDTEYANFVANGDAPLPDAVMDIVVDALCAKLFKDDAFTQQAALCANYVENAIADIRQGATSFAPAPTLINTEAPSLS